MVRHPAYTKQLNMGLHNKQLHRTNFRRHFFGKNMQKAAIENLLGVPGASHFHE
jgi:hypothetical protein